MANRKSKPIMRSLGEFVGHIWGAVKTDPQSSKRKQVSKTVEERREGNVTLRRTVIEEIEVERNIDD
ncbi:MAG TPA: hypothetical protein VG711_06590 [Phycisphaerales bacterium]|nr:hypothetical protein [Phycisphaerales bacterium]